MRSTQTLVGAIDTYAAHLARRPISDNTRKAFLGDVRIFAAHVGAESAIHTIRPEHVKSFLHEQERSKTASSPKSIERRLTSLKVFFGWLHDNHALPTNPADSVAYKPLVDPLPEFLTDAQLEAVMRAAREVSVGEKLEMRPLLAITLVNETAIKKSECLNLTVDDFDRSMPSKPAVWIRYQHRKLKFKERLLMISRDCMKLVDDYIAQRSIQGKLFDCTGRNLEYMFNRRVAPLVGVDALTFEMVRWTCAVREYRELYATREMNDDQMRLRYGLSPQGWIEMAAKLARINQSL